MAQSKSDVIQMYDTEGIATLTVSPFKSKNRVYKGFKEMWQNNA